MSPRKPAIHTIASLQAHLQVALRVEHATIPPYLAALYSIPDGSNVEAAQVIRSVVMEEMLHMTLVANLLNAVGGRPVVADPSFPMAYPCCLPHSSDITVELLPLCDRALATFLRIERPEPAHGPPEADRFHTLGQFYDAVREGLAWLCDKHGEAAVFTGRPERQVPARRHYYGGGGDVIEIHGLADALRAIEEVKEQGEGSERAIDDGDGEPAHYFRFLELRAARRFRAGDTPESGPTGAEIPLDWSVIAAMRPNPRVEKYAAHPEVQRRMIACNRSYTTLLRQLDLAYNGQPDALLSAVPLMYEVRYQAQALMRMPSYAGDGTTAGPSFEYDPGAPFA